MHTTVQLQSQPQRQSTLASVVHSGLALVSAALSLPIGVVGIVANVLIIRRLSALRDRL